jgi:DNA repair protein RadC
MEKNNSIKNWSPDDRPREKLLLKGKEALSHAELLAILIGSGTKAESAVDLCKRILQDINHDLAVLGRMDVNDLMKYKGIGEAKAITIITAMEIGFRRKIADRTERSKIKSSKDAFELIYTKLCDLPHEEFWVMLLNNSNRLMKMERVSIGGITGTVADVRIIFKRALEEKATSIIVCHNHPSGNKQPSEADKKLTKKLSHGGEILDIKVLDHLIVTESEYFSFADEQMMT